ncbi:MAG: hypothetical protein K0R82_1008 [Flavipsychrobacter sp.]|jgi:glycosyltransferase involved in cell wall biosynthesis|nr:hypothetical protein [Flavipsychrobacter sp.]
MPFFSIIIPSFNSAPYLDATLSSVAAQTFRDFEVVVLDDGSTDNSLQICRDAFAKYGLPGVIIPRPADRVKGVASCRNLGVELAKGEWVCFLDSDDLFQPDKLLVTAQSISKFGNRCKAYHHGSENFDDATGRVLSNNTKASTGEPADLKQVLTRDNIIVTSTVTINRQLFLETGGFDTVLHGVEDYFLWLKVSNRTSWSYSSEILTRYRVRESSLMSGREFKHYVEQNTRLYNAIRQANEFKNEELKVIHDYILKGLMPYYASVSLATKGKSDFFSGLAHLFKKGEYSIALNVYSKYLRHVTLTKLSNLKKSV